MLALVSHQQRQRERHLALAEVRHLLRCVVFQNHEIVLRQIRQVADAGSRNCYVERDKVDCRTLRGSLRGRRRDECARQHAHGN
jgi:hypothetical protein